MAFEKIGGSKQDHRPHLLMLLERVKFLDYNYHCLILHLGSMVYLVCHLAFHDDRQHLDYQVRQVGYNKAEVHHVRHHIHSRCLFVSVDRIYVFSRLVVIQLFGKVHICSAIHSKLI